MKSPVICFGTYQLCWFVRASLTKAQRLGGLDNRDTCSQSYNKKVKMLQKSKIAVLAGWFLPLRLFLWLISGRLLPLLSRRFPTVCLCLHFSFSYTDNSDRGWEPTLTSSLTLPFDRSYFKYGSVYRFWRTALDPLQWLGRRITSDLD